MDSHILKYHTPKEEQPQLTCEICGKVEPTQQFLRIHMNYHKNRGERNYSCATCNRSFFSETDMANHVCKHFACDKCDMTFLFIRHLKVHEKQHEGHPVFSCHQCEALFLTKRKLNQHKSATHREGKNIACDECKKTFKTMGAFKHHKLLHTGEMPFECDQCPKKFARKYGLERHVLTHAKVKEFSCDSCGQKFSGLTNLKMTKIFMIIK